MHCDKLNKTIQTETCILLFLRAAQQLPGNGIERECAGCERGLRVYGGIRKGEDMEVKQTKRCPKCGQDKPADREHFYNDSRSKTGLSSWCKNCQNQATKRSKKKQEARTEKIEPNPVVETGGKMTLTLDFSEYELMYEDILVEAFDDFRTPTEQAMYLIAKSLYPKKEIEYAGSKQQ